MSTELKYTISRSFSRKIALGNYNMAEFFANHSEEILADSSNEKKVEVSKTLYEKAKTDVENAAVEFKNERVKKAEMKSERKDEEEMNMGLQLEKEDEEDRSKKLKEANEAIYGLK